VKAHNINNANTPPITALASEISSTMFFPAAPVPPPAFAL
jgi:hypothetical protein